MATTSTGNETGTKVWDKMYDVLAAQPRRMIIFSLLKESEDRWLPLPDAAQSSTRSVDSEKFCLRLRQYHLPKLADAEYVRWQSDPFRVQRGPHFEEPALVITKMTNCSDEYPSRLRNECVVIGDVGADDAT